MATALSQTVYTPTKPTIDRATLVRRLKHLLGQEHVLTERGELLVYDSDGTHEHALPDIVVLPNTVQQVAEIVKLAAAAGVPIVPRGAGTGLAGGSTPIRGGIVVSLTRMNQIRSVDYANRRAIVDPGVVNLHLSQATLPHGYYYAPDPASQRASTIGGNVATNAGGPHCLAYGVTVNHILGLEVVLPDGRIIETGGVLDAPGYDLTGMLVGSEGTMGIVTGVTVKLLRSPETLRVLLAIYDELDAASLTVTNIIGAGIIPGALEMMDGPACKAVEMTYHAGYPDDGRSIILLIELDGLAEGLDELAERVTRICNESGAREVRVAATQAERDALWAGRKGALGAMGRLAPNYYQQDSVVPRTKLPQILNYVAEVAKDVNLQATNIFHAGDGNLHPLLLFDRSRPGEIERTLEAAMEITRKCIDMGGAITGEHGVGFEKRGVMTYAFTTDDLAAMAKLKRSFNPYDFFNPDKILPASLGCGEARELASSVMPLEYAKVAAASSQPAAPIGTVSERTPTSAHEHATKPAHADIAVPSNHEGD
jgi:glycolate oxidase